MEFLLDQSADFRLAAFLRERSHDVTAIGEDYPSGLADEEVLAIAEREGRALITSDLDFGELVVRYESALAGVILFRFDETDVELKRRGGGAFWIATAMIYRISSLSRTMRFASGACNMHGRAIL